MKKLLFIFLLCLMPLGAFGATRTISDAGGNWNATTAWVENAVPTSADDVVATATSGDLTINVSASCNNFDMTNYVGILTHNNGQSLSVYGYLTLVASMTYTNNGGGINLNSSSSVNITTNGIQLYQISFAGSGTFTLQDDLTVTYFITHTWGTLNANNHNITTVNFQESSNNIRILNMGSGIWTISGTVAPWGISGNNLTLNADTSTIVLTNTSSSYPDFGGGGKTYYNLSITGGGSGGYQIFGSNTFNNFTINAPKTVKFVAGTTQTINGTFTATGTAVNGITLNSVTGGTQFNLSKASGTVTVSYCTIKDSNATGGATWDASNKTNIDNGNNSGWYFYGGLTINNCILNGISTNN